MTQKETPSSVLDEAYDNILEGVQAWKRKNTPETIKHDIQAELEKKKKEIIYKLLGFDNRWGKLEVDHCNGRAGESAAGDYLRRVAQPAIDNWFDNITLPPMNAAVKNAMLKTYKTNLQDLIRRKLYAQAEIDADAYVQNLANDLIKSEKFDAHTLLVETLGKKHEKK